MMSVQYNPSKMEVSTLIHWHHSRSLIMTRDTAPILSIPRSELKFNSFIISDQRGERISYLIYSADGAESSQNLLLS
jgi:hypothetical protein